MQYLLAIPKNLVYIFVCIILFAFAAVCWIAYNEKDLQSFIEYDRSSELGDIDPIYGTLHDHLEINHYQIDSVQASEISPGQIIKLYVRKNKPLVLTGHANSWAASNWFDLEGDGFQYLR